GWGGGGGEGLCSSDGGVSFSDVAGATSATLTFSASGADNGKEYRARFSNSCGANVASSAATLTVNSAPVVTLNPASQAVCPGNVTFSAAASGTPSPSVQWQVSTDGGVSFSDVAGATSATFALHASRAAHA